MKEVKACKYEGEIRIQDKKWKWCHYFNCEVNPNYCEKCEERDLPIVYPYPPKEAKPDYEAKTLLEILNYL